MVADGLDSGQDMKFGEWAEQWMEHRKTSGKYADKTLASDVYAMSHILPTISNKRFSQIKIGTIENLYQQLIQSGLSGTTVNQIHRSLHTCWKKAMTRGLTARDVVQLAEHPAPAKRDPYVLSRAEWVDLKDASYKHPEGLLVELLMFTGLRVNKEALSLKWDDINLEQKRLTVVDSKTRAGERTIPLTPSLCERLAKLKFEHESIKANPKYLDVTLKTGKQVWNPEGLVFVTANGNRQSLPNLYTRMYAPVKAIAGVPSSLTFHDLRHNYGSYLLSENIAITTVSKMMGHANPSITMSVYAHALEEDQSLALDALNKMATA